MSGPRTTAAGVSVRAAREDELDVVGRLTLAAYQVDGYVSGPTDTGYATALADSGARLRGAELLVAVDAEDRVLGSVTIALPATPFAELSRPGEVEFRMLAVAPEARGRGIGELLTRAVLARTRELGLSRVALCSSVEMAAAHRLYGRLGFTRLPERDWQPGPQIRLIAFHLDLTCPDLS